MAVPEITVRDYKALLDAEKPHVLVDVRQPDEREIASLGGLNIPVQEIEARVGELESYKDAPLVVVYCRSGARSGRAVEFLQRQGFENTVNLKGGVLAWSDEIDDSMQKY